MASIVRTSLDEATWHGLRDAHVQRLAPWVEAALARRSRGERHPVEDFLFDYYPLRPSQLLRWHPGAGIRLTGESALAALEWFGYRPDGSGVSVDEAAVLGKLGSRFDRIARLLRSTAGRSPQFGCFGMHEWAMVYGQSQHEVRHPAWPLRLSPARTASVVDELGIRCSHFDAFRFFAPSARPLNVLQPTRQTQLDLEQPGCLHATMDLYKWAYQLLPLVPSELVADAFLLARDVRALDMRASPYDLSELGYLPVPVETSEGRAEYAAAQRAFADRAAPIRAALTRSCGEVVPAWAGKPGEPVPDQSALRPARSWSPGFLRGSGPCSRPTRGAPTLGTTGKARAAAPGRGH